MEFKEFEALAIEADIPARIYKTTKADLQGYNLPFFSDKFFSIFEDEGTLRAYFYKFQQGKALNFFGDSFKVLEVYYAFLCSLVKHHFPVLNLSIFDLAGILNEADPSNKWLVRLNNAAVIGIEDFYKPSYNNQNPLKTYDRYTVQNFIQSQLGNGKAFVIYSSTELGNIHSNVWDLSLIELLSEYNQEVIFENNSRSKTGTR